MGSAWNMIYVYLLHKSGTCQLSSQLATSSIPPLRKWNRKIQKCAYPVQAQTKSTKPVCDKFDHTRVLWTRCETIAPRERARALAGPSVFIQALLLLLLQHLLLQLPMLWGSHSMSGWTSMLRRESRACSESFSVPNEPFLWAKLYYLNISQ